LVLGCNAFLQDQSIQMVFSQLLYFSPAAFFKYIFKGDAIYFIRI
jgi:hypothetical protein